jgi:TonB family protein
MRARAAIFGLGLWLAAGATLAAEPGPTLVARVQLVDALPPSPSVAARLEQIRTRIEEALVYPPLARAEGHEGESHVEFEIDANGRAANVETTGSSGYWQLDRAARRAVEDAAPLPYVWGRLEVPVSFELDR